MLASFYFVIAGLWILAVGFFVLRLVVISASSTSDPGTAGDLPMMGDASLPFWMNLVILLGLATGGVLNLIAGLCLRFQEHRRASMLLIGLLCVQVPIGTLLGGFALVVLMRRSVRDLYES